MSQDEDSEIKKLHEYREKLKPMVTDTVLFMNKAIKDNKKIVVEGANAAMLDIDFGTDCCVYASIGEQLKLVLHCQWPQCLLN